MIVEKILELPQMVNVEGVDFQLQFFINHAEDFRLCYGLFMVDESSVHAGLYSRLGCWNNKYITGEDYPCDFLFLIENISDDEKLLEAIEDAKQFLLKHKLI